MAEYAFVCRTDVKDYYGSIDQEHLFAALVRTLPDGRVAPLLWQYLRRVSWRRKKKSRRTVRRNTSGLKRGGPGRRKGVPNRVTVEAKTAAAALVDDPVYRAKLARDLRKRRVAPLIEQMLWFYAKRKPVERHEVGTPGDFSNLTNAELRTQVLEALKGLP